MSDKVSPGSDKMDISETSDTSHELSDSSQVLRLSNPTANNEHLDNETYDNNTNESIANKNLSTSQNATNCHPLMYTLASPDYPDLIPEKPTKNKFTNNCDKQIFNPLAHSSILEVNGTHGNHAGGNGGGCGGNGAGDYHETYEKPPFEMPNLGEYSEKLPDFPESPSALKKSLMYDLPLEVTHTELSDTENDKSVYEAHLSSNLQNVQLTMNEKEGNLNFLARNKRSNKLRRVKVVNTDANEDNSDISSLDSVSESLKSEIVFAGDLENDLDEPTEDRTPEAIEPLSAADERHHSRHWQRMILPGGEQKTIDMRVIEPYKRVLSHGGYLRAVGHTAIVIFSACYLPDKSRVDYVYVMDNLFLYVLWTLEQLVTDDYVLVYLHGGATRLPAFSWLKRCYQMVGRKLRKNLSHLYLVHPTLWIKTMLFMAKPFISSKFYRKISYIGTLRELMIRVPIEATAIPDKVKDYDRLHCIS